jgi:hypothetical protein
LRGEQSRVAKSFPVNSKGLEIGVGHAIVFREACASHTVYNGVEPEQVQWGAPGTTSSTETDLMMVPRVDEELQLVVNSRQKYLMQKPNVICVVDIKPVVELELSEMFNPGHGYLISDIHPQALYTNIMYAPKG